MIRIRVREWLQTIGPFRAQAQCRVGDLRSQYRVRRERGPCYPCREDGGSPVDVLAFLTAGTDDQLAEDYVRGAQPSTLLAIVRGWSGVRKEIEVALVNHLNHAIVPNVPRHGSMGRAET